MTSASGAGDAPRPADDTARDSTAYALRLHPIVACDEVHEHIACWSASCRRCGTHLADHLVLSDVRIGLVRLHDAHRCAEVLAPLPPPRDRDDDRFGSPPEGRSGSCDD